MVTLSYETPPENVEETQAAPSDEKREVLLSTPRLQSLLNVLNDAANQLYATNTTPENTGLEERYASPIKALQARLQLLELEGLTETDSYVQKLVAVLTDSPGYLHTLSTFVNTLSLDIQRLYRRLHKIEDELQRYINQNSLQKRHVNEEFSYLENLVHHSLMLLSTLFNGKSVYIHETFTTVDASDTLTDTQIQASTLSLAQQTEESVPVSFHLSAVEIIRHPESFPGTSVYVAVLWRSGRIVNTCPIVPKKCTTLILQNSKSLCV